MLFDMKEIEEGKLYCLNEEYKEELGEGDKMSKHRTLKSYRWEDISCSYGKKRSRKEDNQ